MVTVLDPRTALVVIDMQLGVLRLPRVGDIGQVLANTAALLAAFRRAGLPVVLVRVQPAAGPRPLRHDAQSAPPVATAPDWLALPPEIQPAPTDILLTKAGWGAFHQTPLHAELQQRQVTGLVLAGVSTSIGVESTAREAFAHGYNVALAADAMTDTVASAHENSLRVIFPRLGEVDTTAHIIRALAALGS